MCCSVIEYNGFKLNEVVIRKKDNKHYRIEDWTLNPNNDEIIGVVLDLQEEFSPIYLMVSFQDIEKII